MLTAAQFDSIATPVVDFYEEFSQSVINDIARRLIKMGNVTATAALQTQRLIESGQVYENVIKQLAKMTGMKEKVLRQAFIDAGVKAIKFDDSIYIVAGLKPIPLNLSPQMLQVLQAGLNKTNALIDNLTMTTAVAAQQAFINAADLAYQQIITGTMSYDEAIKRAIRGIGASGLEVIYPTGHKDKLDVAMRRAVLTGVGQTTGQLQIARAEEMGQDLIQVSAHIGARPSHQLWQGKIYSRSGASDKYPDFVESTGYGTGPGLGGWNCRHSWYPFFEGISENAYSKAEREQYASETVTYQGKKISAYDASQIQRSYERKVRQWKRQAEALKAVKLDAEKEIARVKEWQARLRDFVKQTGLRRQYVRERI